MTGERRSPLDVARACAAASPMADWLNLSVADRNEEHGARRIYSLGFDERHIGNPAIRALNGGAVGAFLELAAECELTAISGPNETPECVNISIDYLRSSRPKNMNARVTLVRKGRRLSVLEVTGWQGDEEKPVATARVCFHVAR